MFMLSSSEVIYEQENNKNKIHIFDYDKQSIFNYFPPKSIIFNCFWDYWSNVLKEYMLILNMHGFDG